METFLDVQNQKSGKEFLLLLLPCLSSVVQPEFLVEISPTLLLILHKIEQLNNNERPGTHFDLIHRPLDRDEWESVSSPRKCP